MAIGCDDSVGVLFQFHSGAGALDFFKLQAFLIGSLMCGSLLCETAAGDDELFKQQIAPILQQRCLSCHGGAEPSGDFSLQDGDDLQNGGLVNREQPHRSRLLELVTPVEGKAEMPREAEALAADELAAIRQWIEAGGDWPQGFQLAEAPLSGFDWWSFTPLSRPAVPAIEDEWASTPIDKFILAKLEQTGLTHAAAADRRTLIRRVTYDLIGLPPTPTEVEAFVNNPAPTAYAQLVDRLLNSQHYGERWARHWLDIVKYADTHGYDKDKLRPNAWPYRDYVIRSFNEDKTYARFIQEQVAGDVLFPGEADSIQGLGFLAAGPWDFIGHVEVPESKIDGMVARNLDRDDMVSNTLNTFCSTTVQCARCHHHRFDPITQEQYYGLQAIFAAVDRADRPYNTTPEIEHQRAALESQLAERLKSQAELIPKTAKLEATGSPDASTTEQSPQMPEQSAEVLKQSERLAEQIAALREQLAELPVPKFVYAAATEFAPQGNFKATHGKPRSIPLLHRGNVTEPKAEVPPGVLPLGDQSNFQFSAELDEAARRAALADWLTQPDHPLVWRSIVNRIWQYHFGQGLVATPNDFGRMGSPPTHPELLDWLAVEFRDSGGTFKALHRLIVTSSVYQQSATDNVDNSAIDGSNQYLWRANRRRLEAEEIRDSMLSVSGLLDCRMGGPGYYLFALEKTEHSPHFEYHKFDPADPATHRRSIYRFIVRSQPDPWMTTLDCADSSQSTPRRDETLTSLQALALLNNRFNLEMAQRFAQRVAAEPAELSIEVERAFQLLLQRSPTAAERQQLLSYAQTHGLANLCRFMFNLSEFVFLD